MRHLDNARKLVLDSLLWRMSVIPEIDLATEELVNRVALATIEAEKSGMTTSRSKSEYMETLIECNHILARLSVSLSEESESRRIQPELPDIPYTKDGSGLSLYTQHVLLDSIIGQWTLATGKLLSETTVMELLEWSHRRLGIEDN